MIKVTTMKSLPVLVLGHTHMQRVKADRLVYIREQQSNLMHKTLQENSA